MIGLIGNFIRSWQTDENFHSAKVKNRKATRIVQNAVDEYLAFCKEVGKEPEKEYKGTFNVRIESSLHRRLAMYASRMGESLNSTVEKAIEA